MTQRRKMGDRRRAQRARWQAALASTHAEFPGVYNSFLRPEAPRIVTSIVDDSYRLAGIPTAPELPQRRGTFGVIRVKPACAHWNMPTRQGLNVCPGCGERVLVGLDVARHFPERSEVTAHVNGAYYRGIVDHHRGFVSLLPAVSNEKKASQS